MSKQKHPNSFIDRELNFTSSFTEWLNGNFDSKINSRDVHLKTKKGIIVGQPGTGKTALLSQIRYSFQQLKKETVLFNLHSIQSSKESLIEHVFNVTKTESTESLNSYSNLIILLKGFEKVEREGFIGEISRLIDAIPDVPIYITATAESLKKWQINKIFKDFDFIFFDIDRKAVSDNIATKLPSSNYELMSKFTSGFIKQGNQFWWLKRPEGLLVDIDAPRGVNYQFKKRNSQGELRKGLDAVKKGDIAFAYRTEEFNVLDGIYIVNDIDKNDDVSFQFIQKLDRQIPWLFIIAQKEFKGSSVVANNAQETIYQLNISQVNLIFLHGVANFRLLQKKLIDVGNTATHSPIILDIKLFSEKNAELVRDTEFYFQKAIDVLEELKGYDNLADGFVDLKEIKKAASQKKSSYELINTQWKNRGKVTPSSFIAYLREHQPELIPLYELISKFISYIDRNAWNKDVFNEYDDNRVIAKTGVNQTDLVSHFLDFALNGFEIESHREGFVFSNTIEYLRNPEVKFNILSKNHRPLISKYFLGAIYSGDEFHSKLKNYFKQEYQLSVVNLKNLTCFYTIIIYDVSIKPLWDVNNGGKPPIIPVKNNENNEDDENDKVPLHLDQVEKIDRLNRQPVAKSISRLINNQIFSASIKKPWYSRWYVNCLIYLGVNSDWFVKKKKEIDQEKEDRHAFMVHLQGAWGDGKSTFLNLIKNNLNIGNNKWVIIEFNAWQHQHLDQPWWHFLDQIYEQGKGKISCYKRPKLRIKETFRRMIQAKLTNQLVTLNVILWMGYAFIHYFPQIVEFAKIGVKDVEGSKPLSNDLVYLSQLISTLTVIVVAFVSVAKFVIKPILLKSSLTAKSFMERTNDPMMKVKTHFENLVSDFETSGYRLAVFVDDLDRCNSKFAVELLEGIQTLYKDRKVLYIVAGDKKWISTCFENHYDEFKRVVEEPEQKLGYLFIEKAFQLSIRLPRMSELVISNYWEFILSGKKEKPKKQIKEEKMDEMILEMNEIVNKFTSRSPKIIQDFSVKHEIDPEEATDIYLESKDNSTNEFEHIFRYNYKLLKGNPRSIKRLANQYNITSNTLDAEFRDFDKVKLFRWIILQNDYPVFTDWIEENIDIDNLDEELEAKWKRLNKDLTWLALFKDNIGGHGGELTIDDIKNLLGK